MNLNTQQLSEQIGLCLIADRQELRKILAAIRRNADKGQPFDRLLKRFNERVERSSKVAEKRSAMKIVPRYDDSLPISAKREQIKELIKQHQIIVLAGETGSGKTTQLPKFCLELGRGVFGLIGHTQPRRLAARAVASRIAEELNVELGSTVGFQVRFNDYLSEQSRVKLMTDGILLAEIQHDPLLLRYDTLIIDEAHERSLNIDFLLGYLKRILPKRPDLKLIITSATIDLERFARHFDAPVMEVSGRTYPVEVIYQPLDEMKTDDGGEERDLNLQQAIVQSVRNIEQLERDRKIRHRGDVLVFLSGERDIRETAEALRKQQFRDTEILPLYARLGQAEQNRIFRPSGRGRRIVLSTNVAETSLTVPGIKYVVDPGNARISRYSYRSKVQRLPIEPVSQASANQRKGRCGRVSEGICVRLYSEDDFNNRPAFTDAEIVRTNLASVILQMQGLGLGKVEDFPFIDPPDSRFIRDGVRLLQELQALDTKEQLTAVGRDLSRIPVDPRIGRMVLEAKRNQCLSEVLIIASALSIQDPRERPLDKKQAADEKHRLHQDKDSDFIGFLNLWNQYEEQRQELSNSQLRAYCKKHFISFMRMREWRDLHRQLHLSVKSLNFKENKQPASDDAVHRSLLAGLLSHIGQQHENKEYLGARNRKFLVFPGSSVAKGKSSAKWIMAAELVETSRLFARVVAVIDPKWVEPLAQHLINRSYSEPHWERKAARVVAYEQQTLYGLAIVSKRKVHYGTVDPDISQQIFIRSALVEGDFKSDAPFYSHNRSLLKEVEALEDKSRRRDILIDEEQLFEFYREVLLKHQGEAVVNGASFEQWRKKQEQQDSKILFVTKQQLMQHDAQAITENRYPDTFNWKGMSLRLSYRFQPGADDDGVSLIVPVAALNRLPHKRLQWLVPGMLRDKCIALLKALPKQLRKNFVPIPDYVDAFIEASSVDDVLLTEAISIALRKMTGVSIPQSAWEAVAVEDHYLVNYRVLDEKGDVLASSRDWKALSGEFGDRSPDLSALPGNDLERENIVRWDFGDLPKEQVIDQAGFEVSLFPGLCIQGKRIDLKLFDHSFKAEVAHRLGVIRLIQQKIQPQIKFLQKDIARWGEIVLMFSTVGTKQQLWSDFIDAVTDRCFLQSGDSPRTEGEFSALIDVNKSHFNEHARQLADELEKMLRQYRKLQKQLSGAVALDGIMILNDIREQLNNLIYKGFLANTPVEWLKRYPVYLQAIEIRLEKYRRDVNQQRFYSEQLSGYWQQYQRRCSEQAIDCDVDSKLLEYRWMLEEYRVSLFAQTLRTLTPVSSKRLEKHWRSCN